MRSLLIGLALILATGCQTTKDGRGNLFRRTTDALGNPIGKAVVAGIYGTGSVQNYRLPEGWDLAFAPVDADGNWIQGVAGYLPFIFPTTGDAASFIPAAFLSANMLMPPPSGGPPPPLRPVTPPEPIRPQYDDLIDEAVNATRGRLGQ